MHDMRSAGDPDNCRRTILLQAVTRCPSNGGGVGFTAVCVECPRAGSPRAPPQLRDLA
jgi:hypothetical protein